MSILGAIDINGGGSENIQSRMMKLKGEIIRGLTTNRDNHANALLPRVNIEHVFQANLVEVKSVAAVIIRTDCLWIEIQKNRAVAQLSENAGGVYTAPVKLNRTAYAIRARSEKKHVLTFFGLHVISFSIERQVEIIRLGRVLGCQSVDLPDHWGYPHVLPVSPNNRLIHFENRAYLAIGESGALGLKQKFFWTRSTLVGSEEIFDLYQMMNTMEKPFINVR